MTVGIAVVANRPRDAAETREGANALVLVVDKQITQGTGLKADVEVEKKLELLGGWHLLFAGHPSTAHKIGFRLRRLRPSVYKKRELLAEAAERVCEAVWQRQYEKEVLRPNLLTERLLVERPKSLAPLDPLLMAEYYRSRVQFEESDPMPHLILAGFDEGRASLVIMKGRDAEIDQLGSYRVIGEGESAALPRLHELGAQASDPLHVALYNALAAKFASEHVASVGPGTDAWILRRGGDPHRVDQALIADVRKITERRSLQWRAFHRRPGPLPSPGWQRRMKDYADGVLGGKDARWVDGVTSSPTAPVRPSSRSRSGGRH